MLIRDSRLVRRDLLGVIQVVHLLVPADLRLVTELLVGFLHALAHVARRAGVAGRGSSRNLRLFILEAEGGRRVILLDRVRRGCRLLLVELGDGMGRLVGRSAVSCDI